jgi:hypothetical protein
VLLLHVAGLLRRLLLCVLGPTREVRLQAYLTSAQRCCRQHLSWSHAAGVHVCHVHRAAAGGERDRDRAPELC